MLFSTLKSLKTKIFIKKNERKRTGRKRKNKRMIKLEFKYTK
jgi:hypothetical protein